MMREREREGKMKKQSGSFPSYHFTITTIIISIRTNFWRECGRKHRFALAVGWLLKKNESLHTWVRKYEEGTFPLIKTNLEPSVKQWPTATSPQEVECGAQQKQTANGARRCSPSSQDNRHNKAGTRSPRTSSGLDAAPRGKPTAHPHLCRQSKGLALTSQPGLPTDQVCEDGVGWGEGLPFPHKFKPWGLGSSDPTCSRPPGFSHLGESLLVASFTLHWGRE